MLLAGLTGTGSGKLGSSVFSVTAGKQIVRQYQPVVTNPSTQTQVNNRARLKLISQLSAVMSDVIAIPRKGNVSSRNLFVSDNYHVTEAINGVATVDLSAIGLTRGGVQIPYVNAERVDTTSIDVALADKADQIVDRVVYIMFYRNRSGELQLADSAVVETAGADGKFPYSFGYIAQDVVVYAYGIFDKNNKATAKFSDYAVETGTQVASLISDRKVSDKDYLISKTQGIFLVGETSIEVTLCKFGNTTIAATGTTNVPYASTGRVEVHANDVEGKYLSITIDGNRLPATAFGVDGRALSSVGAFVGGEVVRVQIGVLSGEQFVPQYTYGGTIVMSQQNTAITSLTANGVAIAASGNTQIAQAASVEFDIVGTGCINKYFRVSVNGVARVPVLFVNMSDRDTSNDTISNLNVGDVVTFQVGRVVNNTFVEDVAYGGSAVIAEVPATFTGVTVNGTNVAASGTTDVVAQATNTYVFGTQNAIGKYLAFLDGNNVVQSVHAISGNSLTVTDAATAGTTIKFAIGTGSSVGTFVAQTNYGGTVSLIEAPAADFSNVTVNGNPWNGNMELSGASVTVAATTKAANVGQWVMLARSNTKPAINSIAYPVVGYNQISNTSIGVTGSLAQEYNYWLCICEHDDIDDRFIIKAVYDYSVMYHIEEG